MFPENHHYGHARILVRAATAAGAWEGADDAAILGRVQHGWQRGGGLRQSHLREPVDSFLWSTRNLDVARELGGDRLHAIGAPFIYLPRPDDAVVAEPEARSLLAIPFHGWERDRLTGDADAYAAALERVRDEDGFGRVTVCLYWTEYADETMRRAFESRGFDVVTMGPRDGNPEFLVEQQRLILRHSVVTSNRISTAAFYALWENRPFFVAGPATGLSASDDPTGEAFDAWQRAEYPLLTRDRYDGSVRRGLAEAELGAEHRLSPVELAARLGLGASTAAIRVRLAAWGVKRTLSG